VQTEQAQASPDQEATEAQSKPAESAEQTPVPADLGPRLPMPNDDVLLMLIESSVISLNHANITGNYAVLREMGAPEFQRANSAERLAQIFAQLRGRQLDLSPILIVQPKLFRKPEMNADGMIRVTGFFPTSPERVNFDLIFQPVNSRWRLYGIAVEPSPPPAAARQPSLTTSEEPTPTAENPEPEARPEPETVKPTPAATPKKAKPKADTDKAATSVDVRDRLDGPPPSPPPADKPKQKGSWNPFGR
jgi:hypothetical protein